MKTFPKGTILEWHKCYPSYWRGVVVPGTMEHPAKFSSKLIKRIYDFIVENEWVESGDIVFDPFGGTALGALEAMRHGLSWRGIELEEHFQSIGKMNIDLWNKKLSWTPGWSTDADIYKGDSRMLTDILVEANCVLASPPYSNVMSTKGHGGHDKKYRPKSGGTVHPQVYGNTNGQLGQMKDGMFDLVMSSPPYAKSPVNAGNVGNRVVKENWGKGKGLRAFKDGYGKKDGQLGNMRDGYFDVVISSPPFQGTTGGKNVTKKTGPLSDPKLHKRHAASSASEGYGDGGNNNIGNLLNDNFWSAAKTIVFQCQEILPVGGMSVWVVKDFVKNGKRVEFSRMWRELCESVGFELEVEVRAMLVETINHINLDGKPDKITKEHKSFFRHVAEKKGAPKIDYETVLFMKKK